MSSFFTKKLDKISIYCCRQLCTALVRGTRNNSLCSALCFIFFVSNSKGVFVLKSNLHINIFNRFLSFFYQQLSFLHAKHIAIMMRCGVEFFLKQLLQSVYAYLYHIAGVSSYRQEENYLYWMYEMVKDWIESDDVNKDTLICLSEMKQAEQIGELMEKKIYNHHNLSRFKERLNGFKSKDQFDHDCFKLAFETFALYEQFPNETIYRNARLNRETVEDDDDDDMENVVTMDKYVSFCADAKGLLFQTLFESVNTELQEYGQMEEPVILKHFDGRDITRNSLDFENRVFALIEDQSEKSQNVLY